MLQSKGGVSWGKVSQVLKNEVKQIDQLFIDERESDSVSHKKSVGFVTNDKGLG